MKKQIQKKLMLSRETLRSLAERELAGAVRGGGTMFWCNSSDCTVSCGLQCTRFNC